MTTSPKVSARRRRKERGATAVEYALMVGLIGIGIVGATSALSSKMQKTIRHQAAAIGLGGNAEKTLLSLGQPVNGGFTPGVPAAIGAWSVTTGTVDLLGSGYWATPNGDGSIDLDGASIGGISRSYSTVPLQQYRLSYFLAGNPGGPSPVKTLRVTAGDQVRNEAFDTTGRNGTNMGWQLKTIDFVATADETTVEFLSTMTVVTDPCTCQGAAITGMKVEIV